MFEGGEQEIFPCGSSFEVTESLELSFSCLVVLLLW